MILSAEKICLLVLLLLPLQRNNNRIDMKAYKTKQVIKMLEDDGWYLYAMKGDHRQFKHPNKPGKVTVNGPMNREMDQRNLNSIWHQAGWK